jgi:hypothetical protein
MRVEQFARDFQVALHQDGRDEQRVGVVVKTRAVAAVGGERVGGPGVDAEQVAHGVVVFQPVDQLAAGVLREQVVGRVVERVAQPRRQLLALFLVRLRRALRGHAPLAHEVQRLAPQGLVALDRCERRVAGKVDAARGAFRAVARKTELAEHRADGVVPIRRRGFRRGSRLRRIRHARGDTHAGQQQRHGDVAEPERRRFRGA